MLEILLLLLKNVMFGDIITIIICILVTKLPKSSFSKTHRLAFPNRRGDVSEEYLDFLYQNGWHVQKSIVLKASFPMTYAECIKIPTNVLTNYRKHK